MYHVSRIKYQLPNIVALCILLGGLLVSVSVFVIANAQEGPTEEEIGEVSGIVFPVSDLGNCGSKSECKAYCDDVAHIEACVAFAEAHGLMSNDEAVKARSFGKKMRENGGPGGCKAPRECRDYCENIDHIEECISFAESQGLNDTHVNEGKKILKYIKEGGEMPGGCRGKEECGSYCSNVDHFEECIAFAERVGIEHEDGGDLPEGVNPAEMMRRFKDLAQRGETPGGCRSKDECESYCRGEEDHFEECVAFGEKMGFMKKEEAELMRKTGGKGPGGCDSKESCEAYCNNPEHQEECFNFAKERGLIKPEDMERMKEGMANLKAGIEQAPPEVAECLKSVVGPTVIEDIQAGRLTPGPAIGERVRGCFEKFGHQSGAGEVLKNAPPEALACIKEKLGDRFTQLQNGEIPFTPELGDAMRVCFESFKLEQGGFGPGPDGHSGPGGAGLGDFLRSAPPGVVSCVKEKLPSLEETLKAGGPPPAEVEQVIRGCFESFRPQGESFEGVPPAREGFRPPSGEFPPPPMPNQPRPISPEDAMHPELQVDFNLPQEIVGCVKEALGVDVFERVKTGILPETQFREVIQRCLQALPNTFFNQPPPIVQPPPPEGTGTLCAQVIVRAQNPETRECREFRTPCEVPPGWLKGCETRTDSGALRPLSLFGIVLRSLVAFVSF